MTSRRIVALFLAVLAAFLIAFAGKSCAKNIAEQNKKSSKKTTNFGIVYTQSNNDVVKNDQPIDIPEQVTTAPTEIIQTVTNLLGEVIGTVPPTTAIEGAPLETEQPEVTKSILDSYNESQQKNEPTTSDFNNYELEDDYTIPSSISIEINF